MGRKSLGEHTGLGEGGRVKESIGALDGLRIVEFGQHVAASYCTKLLADLGATVTKVESPRGDPLRRCGPHAPGQPDPVGGGDAGRRRDGRGRGGAPRRRPAGGRPPPPRGTPPIRSAAGSFTT